MQWDPPSLEHVSEDMVDQYFASLSAFEPELDLPTKQREAFTWIIGQTGDFIFLTQNSLSIVQAKDDPCPLLI